MAEQPRVPKSLVEEIIDEMITTIAKHQEFDAATVERLRQMAITGDLKKATKITKVIKSM